jgi:hypothetical protein
MMLRPEDCWVTNGPTLYAYFLVENNGNTATANEVLSLYESNYDMWRDLHPDIGPSLRRLGQMGSDVSSNQSIAPGSVTYLWADAISDGLYTTLVRRNAA